MGGWRRRYLPSRRRQNARGRDGGGQRADGEKSASASEIWQPGFKSWEELFCHMAGLSWKKLSETKKLLPFYKKIIQWDDSAAHAAFNNAKTRFYAQINGLPCNELSPDPNEFIDEIDWYATIDPELLMNLEEPTYPIPDDKDGKPACQRSPWDSYSSGNAPIPCMSWADKPDIGDPGSHTAWGSLNKKNDRTNLPDSTTGWDKGTTKDNLRGIKTDTWRRWEQTKDETWEQWQNWKRVADLNYYHSETIEKCGEKREGGRRDLYRSKGIERNYSINCPANNSSSGFLGRKRPNQVSGERSYNKRHVEDQNYPHSRRPADRRGLP